MIEDVQEREVMSQHKTLGSLNGDLVSLIEALEDLATEIGPQLKKISKELSPTVNTIKVNLDRDETTLLLEKLSANTGIFLELLSLLEALRDLVGELEPKIKKMNSEISPLLNKVKANLDRDETFILIEKLSSNMGTFLEMLSLMEAAKDLITEIGTKKSALLKELQPITSILKKFVDDDDIWVMLENALVLKKPVVKFMNELVITDENGNTSTPLLEASMSSAYQLMQLSSAPLVQNLITASADAISNAKMSDIKPVSMFGMISALRDQDVQRATGFLFYVLKQIGKNLKNQ